MCDVGTCGCGPLGPPGTWRTMGEGCGLRLSAEIVGDEAVDRFRMRERVALGSVRRRGGLGRLVCRLRGRAITAP